MAKTFEIPFVQAINAGQQTFTSADGTTLKTLITAGTEGTRISVCAATSDDTADRAVALWKNDGSTDFLLGTVDVPALAGFNGAVSSVDLLNTTDLPQMTSEGAILLEAGYSLKASMEVGVTAAKTVYVVAEGGDF